MKKNIILLSLTLITVICFTACTRKTTNTVESVTTQTTKLESTSTEEETTEEETTEEPTLEKNDYPSEVLGYRNISKSEFIQDEKIFDAFYELFKDRVFYPGEIINCQEELIDAGYNVDEYGWAFQDLYDSLQGCQFMNIEYIQIEVDGTYHPILDSSHNLVLKNNSEGIVKVVADYARGDHLLFTLTMYPETE